VLLRLIEGDAVLQLLQTLEFPLPNQIRSQGPMSDHEEGRVVDTLGQGEELRGQRNRLLLFRPHGVKVPDSPEGDKELRGISSLLAEFIVAGIASGGSGPVNT
jgi:hypothetical protein